MARPHLSTAIHGDLGHWEEAKAQAEQGLRLAQTNHEKISEGWSWIRLGMAIGKMEKAQLDMAEVYILKGIKIFEELMFKPNYSYGHLALGVLYADAGLKEKALEHLKKAESLFQEMGMSYGLNWARKVLETVQ